MSMTISRLTQLLRQKAFSLGFELFGVAAVEEVAELQHFQEWLRRGYAADMEYLQRNQDKRLSPRHLVEKAQSVIVCGKNYHTRAPLSIEPAPAGSGWISRYAWGDDYHDILKAKMQQLFKSLVEMTDGRARGRYYVDTGPVLEKVWAKYAGLGWIGKNTCLINQTMGSYIFLGVIITDIRLAYDSPPPDRCGSCTRCIDACPTDAILAPYLLDANLCISYLTIERRGEIPGALRAKMGRHIFGCDICQEVCPWNRKAPVSLEAAFQPRQGALNPPIAGLLALDEASFREKFRRSPVKRPKWKGFLRNALIAAGNSGRKSLLKQVERYLHDEDPVIREHAIWAYQRLQSTAEGENNPSPPATNEAKHQRSGRKAAFEENQASGE